jgi:hypothetical protein
MTKRIAVSLLERREKSLHDSRQRIQKLYEETERLGLLEVYKDFRGNLRTKKESK